VVGFYLDCEDPVVGYVEDVDLIVQLLGHVVELLLLFVPEDIAQVYLPLTIRGIGIHKPLFEDAAALGTVLMYNIKRSGLTCCTLCLDVHHFSGSTHSTQVFIYGVNRQVMSPPQSYRHLTKPNLQIIF